MTTQVAGRVFVRPPDGGIGPEIAGAVLEFITEDRTNTFTTTSNGQGRYSITLPDGRYYLRATHAAYEDDTSAPGFLVANGGNHTANFFLRPPRITTVIVIRHGEKQDPNSVAPTEPLSTAGERRARALREILFRTGVTTIRVTDTTRARSTAQPLADAFRLTPSVYSSTTLVAEDMYQDNYGDVGLVVAHSDTIAPVVTALGGNAAIGNIGDFDNMFVVSSAGSRVNVLNLQYGEDSAPASARNSAQAMTVLMVGVGSTGVLEPPAQLLHVARGAGVAAIYVNGNQTAMVSPLATSLGIVPDSYQSNIIPQLVNQLVTRHANQTVVVSGTNDDLQAMIEQLGGAKPILYTTDVNHMVVLTRFPSGAVRVLPMRLVRKP